MGDLILSDPESVLFPILPRPNRINSEAKLLQTNVMKINLPQSGLARGFVIFSSVFFLGLPALHAAGNAAQTGWTGGAGALWNNVGNWTNGTPNTTTNSTGNAARILNFGSLGNARPLTTNDMTGPSVGAGVSLNQVFFNAGATNYVLYLYPGSNAPTLFDFNGQVPKFQNDSTNLQIVDMPFKLSGNNGGGAGEIDPSQGDVTLTTNASITLLLNTQLRFFGSAGHIVTLNGPIFGGTSNSCALMGSTSAGAKGPFVIFANTNSCTNTFVNAGAARFAAANVTTNPIALGDTTATTTAPATLQMDNGFLNNSPVTIRAGSSTVRTIGNTALGSGTAVFSGPINLGTNLTTLADAAGALELDGNFDFQNPGGAGPRTLTVAGAGSTLITGSFTNASTGSSVLTKTNAGILTLAGTNNAVRVLFNHGGGVISLTNAVAIGVPTGANYPDKFNFTASATLSVTNSFTLGRNAGVADNAGFRIAGGNTGTFDVAAGSTLTLDGPIIDIPASGAGGLAKSGSGKLVLQQPNTYTGNTTISNGILALGGSGLISNTPNIVLAAGTTFDVAALTSFTLGSGQTVTASGGTVVLAGNVGLGTGSIALNYTNGVPTLQITNGVLNFNNNNVTVTVAGSALPAGSYKLVAASAGGSVSGVVASSNLTINGAGFAGGAQIKLKIVGGELFLIVNHPPTANAMTRNRNAGISTLKIALSELATNWADVDGDALSLLSVGSSTNGVTVTTNGGFLIYSNGNNVNDQFSYLIADPQGAMATNVVNIIVSQTLAGQVQSFGVVSGSPTLSFAGIPGYSYGVQRSTNLPVWVTIWTTNTPSNGLFNFTDDFSDLGGVPPASAFYRLNWQP